MSFILDEKNPRKTKETVSKTSNYNVQNEKVIADFEVKGCTAHLKKLEFNV